MPFHILREKKIKNLRRSELECLVYNRDGKTTEEMEEKQKD